MTDSDLTFLLELLMSPDERGMFAALREGKEEDTVRKMYADFLVEAGRRNSAEMIQKGYVPGRGYPPKPSLGLNIKSGFGSVSSGVLFGQPMLDPAPVSGMTIIGGTAYTNPYPFGDQE